MHIKLALLYPEWRGTGHRISEASIKFARAVSVPEALEEFEHVAGDSLRKACPTGDRNQGKDSLQVGFQHITRISRVTSCTATADPDTYLHSYDSDDDEAEQLEEAENFKIVDNDTGFERQVASLRHFQAERPFPIPG